MLESYITPLVLSYVDKYVKNLKPSDLQLSFWGGDAVLKNLELRLDVLEKELGYPLEFKSGRVQELTIHIPWTAIGSESVEVLLNNVELVVKLKDVRTHAWTKARLSRDSAAAASGDRARAVDSTPSDQQQQQQQQTPGYLAGLLDRIVNNVAVRVRNVVVKVVDEERDLALSVSLKAVDLHTANESWHRKYVYTDSYPGAYSLFRVCSFTDLTVCLDQTGSSGKVDVFEEPFVSRCSFVVRMETKFAEGLKVKQTTHIHCSDLHFSVTETQFCLFLKLMDWLLTMYYSSKKLKGRDDQSPDQQEVVEEEEKGKEAPSEGQEGLDSHGEEVPIGIDPQEGGVDNGLSSGQSQSWGTWVLSLFDVQESGESGESSQGAAQKSAPPSDSLKRSGSSSHPAGSSAFGIYVDNIKVTFMTAERSRQPTFFIASDMASRPMLSIHFRGCMARVEKEASVQRFLVSVGIMSIAASIHGPCVCMKKKAKRSHWVEDFGTNQVKVFTLGRETLQSDALLHGSLFGTPYKHTARWEDSFPAVSFSYDYYDQGPLHQVEQCTEVLKIGAVTMVLGPDVVHRLHHFVSAFVQSLDTHPLRSKGLVVIGDPLAETLFSISVSQILLHVTSNSHFMSLSTEPKFPGDLIPPAVAASFCPLLVDDLQLTIGPLSGNIIMPMYGGNATEELSQRFHAHVELCSVEVDLHDRFNPFDAFTSPVTRDAVDTCMSIPSVSVTYHTQITSEVLSVAPTALGLSLSIADFTASLRHIAVIFRLASSWRVGPTAHRTAPPPQSLESGRSLSLTLKGLHVERSAEEPLSYSLIVKGVSVWVNAGAKGDSGRNTLVLSGPFESSRWIPGLQHEISQQEEGLIKGVFSPAQDQREKVFPILQLSVSCVGISLEPAFLEYIRALPLQLLVLPPVKVAGEVFTPKLSTANSISVTPPATPLPDVEQAQEHPDWFSLLRTLVVKVKVSPSFIMAVQTTQFQEAGIVKSDEFPALVLHRLPSPQKKQALPVLVLALPSVELESKSNPILGHPVVQLNTLPWECRARSLALFVLHTGSIHFLLEPFSGNITVGMNGSVHQGMKVQVVVPSLVINLSKSEANLLKTTMESLVHTITCLNTTLSQWEEKEEEEEEEREGEEEEGTDEQDGLVAGTHGFHPPPLSVLSSSSSVRSVPALCESVATSTSSDPPSHLSWSLWVGLVLAKLTVNLHFASDHSHEAISKLSTNMEGIAFCVDLQRRTTTTAVTQFKVTTAECTYQCSDDNSIWRPFLASGKVFSSIGSVLPKRHAAAISNLQSSPRRFSRDQGTFAPTFIQVEFKTASDLQQPSTSRLSVTVQPFEVVLWLPMLDELNNLVTAITPQFQTRVKARPHDNHQWPVMEATVGSVRVLIPDLAYSNVTFFDMEFLRVTSTPDNPVERFVVDQGAYRRLMRATAERKHTDLPAYQLDMISVAVWGIKADNLDSIKGFTIVTSFSVRTQLSPSLYYNVPAVDSVAAVLACGYSVEVNIDSGTSLVLGIEQAACICSILSTNFLRRKTPVLTEEKSVAIEMDPEPLKGFGPLQVLLMAKSLSVVVLPLESVSSVQSASTITPMLQAFLLDSVLTVTVNREGVNGGLSCFNASINCSSKPVALDLMLLQDLHVMQKALPICLLQTRKGWAPDNSTPPPSFLVVEWNISLQRPPCTSVSVAIKQPAKFHLLLPLVKQLLDIFVAIDSAARNLASSLGTHHVVVQEDMSQGTSFVGDLTLSTTQVLLELCLVPDAGDGSIPSMQQRDTLAGDSTMARDLKEGLLVSWNHCNLTYSEQGSKDGSIAVSGLLLSQLFGSHVAPLVLPMCCSVSLLYYTPTSNLDLPSTKINANCDLIHVQLSQRSILLLTNIANAASEMCSPFQRTKSTIGKGSVDRRDSIIFHSTDDLKTFDFITSAIDDPVPPSPGPHEVVFHMGSPGEPAGMLWCYGEPRIITRLKVSPVPFCVTTEVEVPMDLKVECQLQAWDEVSSSYITMASFCVTETTESVVNAVQPQRDMDSDSSKEGKGPSKQKPYRRWRICLSAFQWTEVDEGEVFVNKVDLFDEAGSQVPISSILSPLSLLTCVRVESFFDRSLIDTCAVSLRCKEVELRLLHMERNGELPFFHQYTAVDVPLLQDLMRCFLRQIKTDVQFCGNSTFAVELKCQCGVEFMDFRDLSWRAAIFPTSVSLTVNSSQQEATDHLTKVTQRHTVSLTTDLATMRVSQGLVHTFTATLEVMKGVSYSGMKLLNHYLICNDTQEEIHFGQASTDEDIPLLSRCCVGYSWRTLVGSTQSLRACLVGDGRWRWTKSFSIDSVGTQVVQLYVGRYLADLFVQITNIGGLQKKVTFTGAWRLFSELPFDLEVQAVCTEPSSSLSLVHGRCLKLCGRGKQNMCTILTADEQLTGFQFRVDPDSGWSPDLDPRWSSSYPVASFVSKPPFLVEVTMGKNASRLNMWCSTRLVEVPGTKVTWSEVTIAPLITICNFFPSDLVVWSSPSASGEDHSEYSLPGKGAVTPLVDFQDSRWYHFRFGLRGTEAVCDSSALPVATFLIDRLPMVTHDASLWPFTDNCDGSQQVGSVVTTLPLATRHHGDHKVQAVLTRSSSNCIMVTLKPVQLVVNQCPQPVVVTIGGLSLRKDGSVVDATNIQIMAGETEVLPEKEFFLKVQCRNNALVTSKPIKIPTNTNEPRGGKGERYKMETSGSVTAVLTSSEPETNHESLCGELSVLFRWHAGVAIVVLTPSTVVVNTCEEALHIWPCELSMETPSASKDLCRLDVAPDESASIMVWHKIGLGTTRAVRVKAASQSNVWSIPMSLSFVKRSFALPVHGDNLSTTNCVFSRHQHQHVTYIVISVDQSPWLLVENHSGVSLEITEAGIRGVDATPQLLLPDSQTVYEPPSLAVTYPVIQEKMAPVQPSFPLQLRLCLDRHNSPSLWSHPLSISSGKTFERVVTFPGEEEGHNRFLVSTHQCGDTVHLSVAPTGHLVPPKCPPSPVPSPLPSPVPSPLPSVPSVFFSMELSQTIICLDDEASDSTTLAEIIRITADKLRLQYHDNSTEGKSLHVTLVSIQVDNMLEHGDEDFAVVLLPRSDHIQRPSLTKLTVNPLLQLSLHYKPHSYHILDQLSFSLQPVTLQLDDSLVRKMIEIVGTYGGLRVQTPVAETGHPCHFSLVPDWVIAEAGRDSAPLLVQEMFIEPISCYFSAKLSAWVYLSCDNTHFHFPQYRLGWVYSNWTELVQFLGAHYTSSLLTHVGSVMGSLGLLGSPGTFVRDVGSGLRDLFTLPYEGITRSPALFVWGVGRGTAAFLYQLSAGALKSLVNFSSSISRNMEMLSLDPNHISYLEQSRRSRPPSHFVSGVAGGVSSFGLSLISAVGGLAEQPLQGAYAAKEGSSSLEVAKGVLTGVGKGLLGVVTKPVGGAMELVSQTGKGLMLGTGLVENVCRRHLPPGNHAGTLRRAEAINIGSSSKCAQKILKVIAFKVLLCCPAIDISSGGSEGLNTAHPAGSACTLILTPQSIHLLDHTTDLVKRSFTISHCTVEEKSPSIDSTMAECTELWIQTRMEAEAGVEVRGLHTVQDCLRALSLSPPPLQPSSDTEGLTAVTSGFHSPPAVLQLESHHSTQLMSFLWSLLKHHNYPDMVFPVHTCDL